MVPALKTDVLLNAAMPPPSPLITPPASLMMVPLFVLIAAAPLPAKVVNVPKFVTLTVLPPTAPVPADWAPPVIVPKLVTFRVGVWLPETPTGVTTDHA